MLCLCLLSAAWAQDAPPAAAPSAAGVPAPLPPVALGGARGPITLDHQARFWIDTGAIRTVEQMEAAHDSLPWKLRQPGHGYRIDGDALWFAFDAINTGDQRWFVELGSSGIDRVQFFYRTPEGRLVTQEAGDTRAVSEWPLPGRLPTFELVGKTDKPVRYWLRVEHNRVDVASPLLIYDQSALFASRENEQFLLGGYFSLAALVTLVCIGNAVAFRDRNFGVYAVYVSALALGQLAYLGVGAQHLWTHWLRWNETASFVLPGLSGGAALWFARTVTEPGRFSRKLDLTVWGVLAGLLSAVALDATLTTRGTLLLMVGLTALALVVVAVLIGLVWTQGDDPHIRLIALGFLPVLVMAIFPIARGFNLIPISPLTRYGISMGAALEMPILFYALSLRGSRRREAQVRASALARNDALTGLAHTRTLLQRLDGALARCTSLKHACAMMAVKISNHEGIVAEFGRETGERVLVIAASLLRGVITDVDMAARIGDHQFALLLEGPATAEDATARAQQLVASGLRSSEALPPGLVLKFHVAVALLPDRTPDADSALKWVLDGVNSMRSDSRKLIRPLNF